MLHWLSSGCGGVRQTSTHFTLLDVNYHLLHNAPRYRHVECGRVMEKN